MNFIIGLGNPGNQYKLTKHNFGFWIVDELAKQRSLKFVSGKGDYVVAKDNEYMIIKPTTFMNNSGLAVKHVLNYFDIFVINFSSSKGLILKPSLGEDDNVLGVAPAKRTISG